VLCVSVTEAGDDISNFVDSECLVLANHQSTGDVLTMVQVLTGASRRRLSQHVCWILDHMFKFTHFGAVCQLHGDIFILQVSDTLRC
jgi:lysophosphatidylglycerol acyltransferase 1